MKGRPVIPIAKDRRGKGRHGEYFAYVQAGDGASQGQRNRLFSPKLGREVVCLSKGEKDVYLLLEWARAVTDIREQYPLYPIEETIAIAQQLGVRPSALNLRGKPMTTDFLITYREQAVEREIAISFKQLDKLANPRVLELADIERAFHQRRGATWGFVTDRDLPRTIVDNLDLLSDFHTLDALSPLTAEDVDRIAAVLVPRVLSRQEALNVCALHVDDLLQLKAGTSLSVAWYLMATRTVPFNLRATVKPDEPLPPIEDHHKSGHYVGA